MSLANPWPWSPDGSCVKRLALARAQGVPPYAIFHDTTLQEIAVRRPGDLEALAQIGGVGRHKLERYGQAFLEGVPAHAAPPEGDAANLSDA